MQMSKKRIYALDEEKAVVRITGSSSSCAILEAFLVDERSRARLIVVVDDSLPGRICQTTHKFVPAVLNCRGAYVGELKSTRLERDELEVVLIGQEGGSLDLSNNGRRLSECGGSHLIQAHQLLHPGTRTQLI